MSSRNAGEPSHVRPRFMARTGSDGMRLAAETPILVGAGLADQGWALAPLRRRTGLSVDQVRVVDRTTDLPGPCVLIGRPGDHPDLADTYDRLRDHLPGGAGAEFGPEACLISARRSGVRVVAASAVGAFYACQTLSHLVDEDGRLPALDVADAPAYPFRGLHTLCRDMAAMPLLERLIAEVLPRWRTNRLILSVGYNFRYASHPEIEEAQQFTADQVRRLVRIGRDNNVQVIPLFNSLGHQSWKMDHIGALLRAYPDFNETPGKPGIKYCYSWCPSNPRVYEVVFDLLDELIEAFQAEWIHLGMDEVFEFGECDRCRGKTNADLFAKAVNDLYGHVAGRRGVKMMIWGDRLIDGFRTPYNEMNGARNGTHPAREMIPRDILLCDWHYHVHEAYPSVEQFEACGFDYVIAGWRKVDALEAFAAYASARAGPHLKGYLATNWHPVAPLLACHLGGRPPEGEQGEQMAGAVACYRRGMDFAWHGTAQTGGAEP